MRKVVTLLFVIPILLGSCGRSWSWADYMAIHKDGILKLDASRQMNEHYAEVDNFIVHFGSGEQPLEWQTVAFVEGRFVLTFVQPVKVDYSKLTVTQVGESKFYLHAVESIEMLPGGSPRSSYEGGLQRVFDKSDWDRFTASGFDLTTLGIPKNKIHSIPNWKEYVQGWRKDQVKIQ